MTLVAWMGLACLGLAVLIGSYWLLAQDWQAAGPNKVAPIYRLGLRLQASRPEIPLPILEKFNGNAAGGLMVILLPLGLGGAGWLASQYGKPTTPAKILGMGVVLAAASFVLLAVILTQSRGSWLATVAGCLAAAYVVWRKRFEQDHVRLDVIVFVAFAAFAAGTFALAVLWPGSSSGASRLDAWLGSVGSEGGSAASRAFLWRDMLPLIADYPFTGSGLGSTMMVYSSYVMMLHVGFLAHAHHLFLQIAVEQGLPAMAAFGVMIGTAAWGALRSAGQPVRSAGQPVRSVGRHRPFPAPAAMAAITALLVHGMVDSDPYVSRLAPVIFLPIGFAIAAWSSVSRKGSPSGAGRARRAIIAVVLVATLGLALLPSTRSALQSNLGAVAQTRAELGLYAWPDWPLQDVVRRSGMIDLTPALRHYELALRLNPANVSANRRLGQVELSLGRYDLAARHLQAAYEAAPTERPARQLLAEIRAITGSPQSAAELWRTIPLAQQQLDLRQWWYNEIGEPEKAALIAEGARLSGW